MKDLYTFSTSLEDLDEWYHKVRGAYINILDRLGLDYRVVSAANGQIGGASSEEFMVLCNIGEDTIVYNEEGTYASNLELCNLKEGALSPDGNGVLKYAKGIEVGHIFKLGTKYSEPMKLDFIDKDNKKKPVIMGCYGIGISRLIMAILEQHHSPELKVLWPDSVAPFKLHIIPMGKSQSEEQKIAMSIYDKLIASGYDVMIDDRNESPGVKFKDADLIGIKYRLIVGRRSSEGIVELINEFNATKKEISIKEAMELEF